MDNKGLTIVELIIAVAIGLIIIIVAYPMIFHGTETHSRGVDEYQIQSDMRAAASTINQVIRFSTVVFAVTEEDFNPDEGLSKGWDYIGATPDRKKIIHYQYDPDSGTHVERVIVEKLPNLSFETKFKKEDLEIEEKLIHFTLNGYIGASKEAIAISSELEALNSLQVIDRGYEGNPSVALAFRKDPRPVAEHYHAAVAMVLDVSGSMAWDMEGHRSEQWLTGERSNNNPAGWWYVPIPEEDRRITLLQNRAKELVESLENASVSLVPFSTNANNPGEFINVDENIGDINDDIDNLIADGGTNTGDGLRRAYFHLEYFNDNKADYNLEDKELLNYIIILVDGVTTFGSYDVYRSGNNYYYSFVDDNDNISSNYLIINNFSGEYTGTGNLWHSRRPAGKGNELDATGTEYVNYFGNIIQNDNELDIKSFVIGFSALEQELDSVEDIATATGAEMGSDGNNYYIAENEEELQEIFDEIGGKIMHDLWQVFGP